MNAYRGDTHHHQVKDIGVEDALEYLRRRGDDFVFLEYKEEDDPSLILDPATLCTPDFLVVPGTEQAFIGRKGTWNHLSIEPLLIPIPDTETDYWHVPDGFAQVNERVPGALTRINHPADGRWTLDDVRDAVAQKARIWELNPAANPMQFAVDQWDECLNNGLLLYATLSTDIHGFRGIEAVGYVTIWADRLEQAALLEAMRAGEFVAVERACAAEPVSVLRGDGRPGSRYEITLPTAALVRFVGAGGETLAEVKGKTAAYEVKGGEGYLRAEVTDDSGLRAFTQPMFVRRDG